MTELIGGYLAANDREQMGRFLRHASPLGSESFTELLSKLKDGPRAEVKPPPTNPHD
jgi:hypothetical protein